MTQMAHVGPRWDIGVSGLLGGLCLFPAASLVSAAPLGAWPGLRGCSQSFLPEGRAVTVQASRRLRVWLSFMPRMEPTCAAVEAGPHRSSVGVLVCASHAIWGSTSSPLLCTVTCHFLPVGP